MGNILGEKFLNLSAYGMSLAGIVTNLGDWKAFILFAGGVVLLTLQIIYHVIKIIKESRGDDTK